MNTIKTGMLLATITALFVAVGGAIGGQVGMIWAFAFAILLNAGSYWFSDKIVLLSQGAQELTPAQAPDLFESVERLTARAGLPMPKVYMVPGAQPNAFATGRDPQHAAVAVTQGIMSLLSPAELEGVIAHELAHVKNRDLLISAIAATLAGAISMIAQMGRFAMFFGGYGGRDDRDGGNNVFTLLLSIIVAPIAALMIQMAISRSREFEADATGARISGKPLALASALQKIEGMAQARPLDINPSMAHLYIVNPLRAEGLVNLFRSHPPTEQRIARLQAIAAQM